MDAHTLREAPAQLTVFNRELVENASSIEPSHRLLQGTSNASLPRADGQCREAIVVSLADIAVERVEWLWPGRIAMGKLTLIIGDPDLGKSFLSLDLAARVSRGGIWPDDGSSVAPLGDVLLLNAEDGLSDTVRPRIDAAGGDASRVEALTAVRESDTEERGFSLARDLDLLARRLNARPQTRLVIIDPISAYLGGGTGINNAEVRGVLTPLAQLAQERHVAVIAITHLNKNSGGRAMYRAMGSLAFVAAARAAWGVVRDPADADRRLFLPVKNNLSRGTKGLAYRLQSESDGGVARVVWDSESIESSIDEILQQMSDVPKCEDRQDATTVQMWLTDILANGPQQACDVQFLAKNEGITRKQLRHAAAKIHVSRKKGGFLEGWVWDLPKT